MILFLDIDGVLHPDETTQEHAFEASHFLIDLIESIPDLLIVISSDWRKYHTINELKQFIFKDQIHLYKKIIGITPIIEEVKCSYRGREEECLLWLKNNNYPYNDWIAIDDIASNFTYGLKNVFLTNYITGINQQNINSIKYFILNKKH